MKKAFVAILSLAALVSCSQDSVVKTSDSTAISFDNMFVENKTRAAADPSTTTAKIDEFAVWGFRGDAQELVFSNERVYKNEDGAWTYDHLQYWMEGKNYFFGAVSPVNDDNVDVDTRNMSEDGLGTISFTNTDGSVDLIYAEKVVYAGEINPSAPEKVELQFAHLLSRVKFSFKYNFPNELTTVAVKNIKINNSPAEGSIDVTKARENWSWNILQNDETRIIDFGHVENGNEFAEMDTYYESDEYRLVIPTDATRNHEITFDVVVYNNHQEAQTYPISTTLEDKAFVQGKSYNIVTEITPGNIVDGGLKPIVFDVIEVLDWDSETDVDLDGEQTEEPGDSEEPTPGYKLYLENEDSWDKVFVYAWDAEGTKILGEWPGVEMTDKETIDEVEYFAYTLSSEFNDKTISVVFNNGNNGKQTADITGVELTENKFFSNYVEPAKPTETKLYLKPNTNWMADGARFAAYLWGTGIPEVWCDMTLVQGETDIYEFTLPEGYDNLIFCRMNPSTTANNWNNKWNQTGDLAVPTDGKNLFTLAAGVWDNATTTWGTYTPAEAPAEPEVLATPVVEASVEGNVVTLTWEAVENAAQYSITVGTEMPVFVEDTTYVFTGEYETEYTFNVVAVPEDEEKFAASEAATAKATTEAEPQSETPVAGSQVSVAKFLEMADTATEYVLTGKVARVANTLYGNFDLTDETGTIYIYGLVSPTGAAQYWAESGVREGDTITIKGKYSVYNNAPQVKNAVYVSHVPAPFVFAEAAAIEADVVEVSISVESNVAWTVSCDAAWVKSYSKSGTNNSDIDIEVEANTTTENRVATFTISGEGVADYTVTLTQYAAGASDTKGTYTSEAFLKGGTDGGKSYLEKVNVGGTQYDCLKLGTSSVIGKYTTKAVGESGDLTLSFYAVGWNGKTSKLNVYVDGVKVGETLTLKANTGAANNAPYTITPSDTTDYYSISVPGITETSKITFETVSGATRAIILGVQLY